MFVLEGNVAVYLFVVLMAMEQGGSTLNWVALGNFFGRRSFATIMGIMSVAFNLGMLVSPIYAGIIFDRTDSYTLVMVTCLPIYLISAVFFLVVQKPGAPVPSRAAVYGREGPN